MGSSRALKWAHEKCHAGLVCCGTMGSWGAQYSMDTGSRNALEMVRALRIILNVLLTENGVLPIDFITG